MMVMPPDYTHRQRLAKRKSAGHRKKMLIAVIAILCAGIANFAMHRAFLESDDPLVQAMLRPIRDRAGRHVTYAIEFLVLVAALLLANRNWFAGLLLYGLYTLLNTLAFNWISNRPR
jgi:hypothetical protein